MLNQDQVQALKAPFPPEALSKDTSRGFELTSIKAAYVIERLNEVFDHCGIGWRYVHSPFEVFTDNGKTEIVTEVALQYRFPATNDCAGCDQVVWDAQANDWAFRNGGSNHDWSEPIFACGGKQVVRERITDARKSAVTDGLTKAASMIGVGHQVFKGLIRAGGRKQTTKRPQQVRSGGDGKKPTPVGGNGKGKAPAGGNGQGQDKSKQASVGSDGKKQAAANGGNGKASSTTFWTLYRAQGEQAGVSSEYAKRLANQGDWNAACAELRTLIAKAS